MVHQLISFQNTPGSDHFPKNYQLLYSAFEVFEYVLCLNKILKFVYQVYCLNKIFEERVSLDLLLGKKSYYCENKK